MSRSLLLFLWIGLGLLPGALHAASAPPPSLFRDAAISVQGETVYGRAELTREFLARSRALLEQGEPVQVIYGFVFYRQLAWLPDLKLSESTEKRRVKKHLIIQRYEMQVVGSGQVSFTSDEEDALEFLGRPRFIPILEKKDLNNDANYRLRVTLTMEQDGVSRMYRLLYRLLNLWKPVTSTIETEYHHP